MPRDIRMRGFHERSDVDAVHRLLAARVRPLASENVALVEAAGRILAEELIAPCPVPGFDRAAMDGFALRGSETFGADRYNPLAFAVVGESLPGRPYTQSIAPGQAVRIMTGAPIPAGADAVIQAEAAEEAGGEVRITEAVAPGRHVGRIGEDIGEGTVLLHAGRRLRPQDVGVLASVGVDPVPVVRRPSVAIFVTGDELLPPGSKPSGYQIVDSNSIMLAAHLRGDGAHPIRVAMLQDQPHIIREALTSAIEDVLLISGGSSVGVEDHAPRVVRELGELPIHGVALRPASPMGVGFIGSRPAFLLPGNPVSCLCGYDLFAGPTIRRLGGYPWALGYVAQELPLARKIASMVGRVDYVRVRIHNGEVEPLAISGASVLSSTTRADGFVLVPADLEGYPEGETVRVWLYDRPHLPLPHADA